MNGHLKRVLILLLIFTFVFQMAGVTSLSRVQAYADTETEENLDVTESNEAEEVTTEEIGTEVPEETEIEGEEPSDSAAEESGDTETVPEEMAETPEETAEIPEETAEVPEETITDETVTVEEPVEENEEPAGDTDGIGKKAAKANDSEAALKAAAEDGAKATKTGTVLAFTSDVHNKSGNVAANRMSNWIENVEKKYGEIDVFAFGGDMADASASGTTFFDLAQIDMDVVDNNGIIGVYTTGNHEYNSNRTYGVVNNETTAQYKVNAEGYNNENCRIYCLGSVSSSSSYSSQISSLTQYLSGAGNDRPIFIITHFPLHYYNSRTTDNASDIIEVLNNAVENNNQKIVFLWGHNHTMSDTYYDYIYRPGDSIPTSSSSSSAKTIKFYYGAAGCMSDSEYGTGSASVKGKALVVTINDDKELSFSYFNENGVNVTEGGTFSEVVATGLTIDDITETDESGQTVVVENPTIATGKTLQLNVTFEPFGATGVATWSSSDETIATVDENGKVKGISEGTATITATLTGSSKKGGTTTSIEVTVGPRNTSTVYFLANELTDGGSYLIVSSKTEGNAYAVTNNGSSSSGTAMGSTAVTIENGDVNGDGTSELYIDTDVESIVWEATANGSGVNLGNNDGFLGAKSGTAGVFNPKAYNDRYWIYSDEYLVYQGNTTYWYEVYYSNNNFTYRNYNHNNEGATHPVYIFEQQTITPSTDPVSGVTLNKTTLELAQGGSEKLEATVAPPTAANKNVSWSSSDVSVATVSSSGTVTGVAPGTATITVTTEDGNFTAVCEVTVTEEQVIEYVLTDTLEADQEYLIANGNSGEVYIVSNEAGAARQLKGVSVTVSDNKIAIPENIAAKTAFTSEGKTSTSGSVSVWLKNNGKYLYTNNADGLKMVESSVQGSTDNAGKYWHYKADGKNLLWFFKDTSSSDGYTDTSQTYKYYLECNGGIFTDGHTSTTSLNSTNTPAIYLFVKKVPVTGVTVSPTTKEIAIGEVAQLSATVAPEGASVKTVTWSSSDTSVATVDTSGKVTGVAAGTATITVTTTDGSFTASCEVTVSAVAVTGVLLDKTSTTVETSKTKQLTATITPANATNKNVSWSSSNDAVATVDEDGVITGVAEGTATITVTTEDGNKTATCSVTVTQRIVRPGYVIVIDDYALSTEPETDYHPESNGTNKYYGLKGVAYDGESNPTEDILWTITPVEGKENTYYIQSMDGRYLNATYQPNDPIEGHLNLDNSQDEWSLDGDLEDWIISGSYLQSTNATTSSKELCLAYETVGNAGNINLFTIRSRANADSSELTSPDITAEVRYEETNTLKDGEEYIIAVTKDDSSVYAVKNVATGTTSTNTGSVTLDVSTENGTNYIITDDAGVPWKYTGSNQNMTNGAFYLYLYSRSNNVPRATTTASNAMAVSYSSGQLRIGTRYLTCSNGTFGSSSSTGAAVRLFEKRATVLYTIKWVGANGAILEEDELAKGDMPAYHGATPVKADDDQYTYTFTGWSPDVETVNGLAVYTAQFEATPKEVGHTITFLAEDGETVISTVNVNHGTEWDEFDKPEAPEKEGYIFAGWANAPEVVTEDVSVTATYIQVHEHDGINFTAWTSTTSLPTEQGSYYLTQDVTLDSPWNVPEGTVNLCLDGHTIDLGTTGAKYIAIDSGVTLNQYDHSDNEGKITGGSSLSIFAINTDGTFNMYGGSITEKPAGMLSLAAVIVEGEFHMYGGSITNNNAAGVFMNPSGAVYVSGSAVISGNGTTSNGSKTPINVVVSGPSGKIIVEDELTEAASIGIYLNDETSDHSIEVTCNAPYTFTSGLQGKGSIDNFTIDNEGYSLRLNAAGEAEAYMPHTWSEIAYTWAEDNSTCTATRTCTACNKEETETVNATSRVTKEATCTEKGETTYTAAFQNSAFGRKTKTVENIPATGHEYGQPVWSWAEDNSSATATFTCTVCGDVQTVTDSEPDETVVTAAGCVTDKVATYNASVAFENETYTDAKENVTVEGTATGHTYTKEYVWTDDGSACTATATCTNCGTDTEGHIITENAAITSAKTKDPTCEVKGETTYTATFTNAVFSTQTKTVADIDALGHDWSSVLYSPSFETLDEYGYPIYCTARRDCRRDSSHKDIETVTMTREITREPYCGWDGELLYTAIFENPAFETRTFTKHYGEQLGHIWGQPTWTWEADYSKAKALFVCERDSAHYWAEWDTAPTRVENGDGTTTFTATVTFEGQQYTNTQIAHVHIWGEPVYTWADDYTTVTATRTCTLDESHVESETAEATSAWATAPADCTTGGQKRWTSAEFQNSAFTKQTTLQNIEPLGHDFQGMWTQSKAPTCTEPGSEYRVCTRCIEIETREIPATGHTWGDWTVTKEATCTEVGVKTRTCYNCDASETSEIPIIAHTPGTAVEENRVEAKCETDGSYDTVVYCSVCNAELSREAHVIPATGHAYGEPAWTWDGFTKATATFTCANDSTHKQTVVAEGDDIASSTSGGTTTYTATITGPDGKTYTNTTSDNSKLITEVTATFEPPIAGDDARITHPASVPEGSPYRASVVRYFAADKTTQFEGTFAEGETYYAELWISVETDGYGFKGGVDSIDGQSVPADPVSITVNGENVTGNIPGAYVHTLVRVLAPFTVTNPEFELTLVVYKNTGADGTAELSKTTAHRGETITVTATPAPGSRFTYAEYKEAGSIVNATRIGEDGTFTMPPYDTEVTVYFVREEYDVTVTTNNEAYGTAKTKVYQSWYNMGDQVELEATPNTGYEFKEWKVISGGVTVGADNKFTVGTADVEVQAVFAPIKYTITYNFDGGTNAEANPAEYTIESDAIALADPSWTGHTFGGWYENAQFTGDPVTTIAKGSTGNVTLYAKWTINTFTVTWVDDDGEILEKDENVAYGTTPSFDADEPTKAATKDYRYEFAGWDPDITAVTGDATYTAKFSEIARTYSNEPVWSWTGNDADGYTSATATFTTNDSAAVFSISVSDEELEKVTTPATCTEGGQTVYKASVEFKGDEYEENKTVLIPAKGHTLTTHAAVAATCEAAGNSAYWSCSECGKYFSDAEGNTEITENSWIIPATGHDWKLTTDVWNTDHTSAVLTFVCNTDDSHTETVPVSGDAITSVITTEPTATTPGVRTYTATVTLDGKTYTVTDSEAIPATGSTVSGNITSYVGRTEEGQVTVQLFKGNSEEAAYEATVTADNKNYTFEGVVAGTYTMKVSKKDHVTRSYEITADGTAITQDVKIHLIGDVNGDGKLTTADVSRVNSHVKKVDPITDEYIIKCGDVVGNDGKLTTADVSRINSHVKKVDFIW